jgi:5-formyltetrahydrofolate cyclo-ligase
MDDDEARVRAKALMRSRFRGLRSSLPREALTERSLAIVTKLVALDEVATARAVALFWPIERHKEVDLRGLDRLLRERGATIAYPTIANDRSLEFRRVDDPATLFDRGHGFAEPTPEAAPVPELDVIVVPGLAFDSRGYRLGYGGGYYDRTLPQHCPPATAIGVAYDFQLAADLPHGAHDAPVAAIVTDRRVLRMPCR